MRSRAIAPNTVARSLGASALFALSVISIVPVSVVTADSIDRRAAGSANVREAADRVAAAVARGDHAALAADPLLRDRPDTVEWLMTHGPALNRDGGYRVKVRRNGTGGRRLMSSDQVSHLGLIVTNSGELWLGFRYDRETGVLTLVTAASTDIRPR
jgi:hypothetical protein